MSIVTKHNTFEEIEQAVHAVQNPAQRPSRPRSKLFMSSTEARKYADALVVYEAAMVEFTIVREAAHIEATRLTAVMQEKLREEHSYLNDATYALVHIMACRNNDSGNFTGLRESIGDYAEIAEKIIAANK